MYFFEGPILETSFLRERHFKEIFFEMHVLREHFLKKNLREQFLKIF